jgi:hypothetical protein
MALYIRAGSGLDWGVARVGSPSGSVTFRGLSIVSWCSQDVPVDILLFLSAEVKQGEWLRP